MQKHFKMTVTASSIYERWISSELSLVSIFSWQIIITFQFEQLYVNALHPMAGCKKSPTVAIWEEVRYRSRVTHPGQE